MQLFICGVQTRLHQTRDHISPQLAQQPLQHPKTSLHTVCRFCRFCRFCSSHQHSMAAAVEQPSTSGREQSYAALSSKFAGLQPGKILEAVGALQKYVGASTSAEKVLFQEDELIYLIIALRKTPQLPAHKHKPIRIPIPNSLYEFDGAQVCLIVKDKKGEGHKAAKTRIKEANVSNVAKVVGVSKLKTKYEAHEAKRKLCSEYDLFVADERVLPQLPKLLGKTFFKKKKQPIPVNLASKDWGAQVQKACDATYMYPASGSSLNIRVARSSFTQQQCAQNVAAAIQGAVAHIPKKWSNVQALFLKTADSVALPIYQMLPSGQQKIGTS